MDFAHDYMRALLAKEIDVAAELQKQRSQVVYQQYCAGGTMHRGYYCPSSTEGLWLGNTKRGRLCKKRPPEERLSHIYGFDASDRLITVKHMHCLEEYILYGAGVTLGVEIRNNSANTISICRYDENSRIQIYEYYLLTPKADQVSHMSAMASTIAHTLSSFRCFLTACRTLYIAPPPAFCLHPMSRGCAVCADWFT